MFYSESPDMIHWGRYKLVMKPDRGWQSKKVGAGPAPGNVPNVVFPCAALADSSTGRIAIYYGAADTVCGLAFTTMDILIDFIKNNSTR